MTNQAAAGGENSNANANEPQPAATGSATAASDGGNARSFNPLSEPAERKPQRQVITDGGQLPGFIPEPSEFDLPPVRSEGDPLLERKEPPSGAVTPPPPPPSGGMGGPPPSSYNGQGQPQSQGHAYGPQQKAPPPREREPLVKPMKELSQQDKSQAAEQAAKMVMMGYKRLNKGMSGLVKVGPYKQWRMEEAGKIDLDLPFIGTRSGQAITPRQFFKQYNDDNDEVFTVSQEFEDEMLPPMTRVFEKRGIGATDEMVLAVGFGMDFAAKVPLCGQLLKQRSMMLRNFEKMYKAIQDGKIPEPPPPVQPQQHAPPPPPTREQQQQQTTPGATQTRQPAPAHYYEETAQEQIEREGALRYDEGETADVSQMPAQDWALNEMRQRQDIGGASGVEHHKIERRFGNKETLRRGAMISARLKKQQSGAAIVPATAKKSAKKK